jgi:type IX secretion system PorP/SprF family membrane protein
MRIQVMLYIILSASGLWAQDPQFSQYYAAPLLLNPALAGSGDCYRAGMSARSQWVGLPGGAFNTAAAFIDLNVPHLRSGFGLMLLHDQIGTPRMSTNAISGFYSYLAPIRKQFNLRLGLQASFVNRSLDYSRLVFEDQFSGIAITQAQTADPIRDFRNANYGDFSSGALIYGEDTYWLGTSYNHMFTPNQAFYTKSKLPAKWSLHGGYSWRIKGTKLERNKRDIRLIGTFLYKSQLKFDQLDLGVYAIKNKVLLGLWYRGIPVKKDAAITNSDAVSVQMGYYIKDFSFIYSYDFTTSKLNVVNTHGSHEISLLYQFCSRWPKRKKPPIHVRRLPCPDFDRSMKYRGTF